jgi:hypothetical protein
MSFRMMSVLLLLLALPVTLLADKPNVEPGLWQYTSTTTIEGAPVPIPEEVTTHRECVTEADLKEEDFLLEKGDECDFYELDVRESGMSYKMICSDFESGTSINLDTEMSFHGDRMQGTITGTMDSPMGMLDMHIDVEAERLGDC